MLNVFFIQQTRIYSAAKTKECSMCTNDRGVHSCCTLRVHGRGNGVCADVDSRMVHGDDAMEQLSLSEFRLNAPHSEVGTRQLGRRSARVVQALMQQNDRLVVYIFSWCTHLSSSRFARDSTLLILRLRVWKRPTVRVFRSFLES
jgi:hypothetical protein